MREPRLIVIGGGLAGLSTGCYALANGFSVTIIEHNLELGGVCTAWRRGPYLVDGCIHWLTGVTRPLDDEPSTLIVDGIHPLVVGNHENDFLYLRIYNEDHAFAPLGHTVVQAMLHTSYDWWTTRGAQYQRERSLLRSGSSAVSISMCRACVTAWR